MLLWGVNVMLTENGLWLGQGDIMQHGGIVFFKVAYDTIALELIARLVQPLGDWGKHLFFCSGSAVPTPYLPHRRADRGCATQQVISASTPQSNSTGGFLVFSNYLEPKEKQNACNLWRSDWVFRAWKPPPAVQKTCRKLMREVKMYRYWK